MNLRNRRELKERRQEVSTEQRQWERQELVRTSRKLAAEKKKAGKITEEMDEEIKQPKEKKGKVENVISLTEVINDYDSKGFGEKKLHEILKMITCDKNDQNLMGLYALYQYLLKNESSAEVALKIHKAQVHQRIAEIMKEREDFRLIILKYLTKLFSSPIYPEICLDIDLLFMDGLADLLQESDFYYLCYGLNMIGKIIRNHQRTEKEMSSQRYKDLIKKVLDANEELSSQQSTDQIVGVKYYIFNSLLESASQSVWPEFVFDWLAFTIRILNQGLIRNKKSKKIEEWLKEDKNAQAKLMNHHEEEIAELSKSQGACYYLLYLLNSQKTRLMNLKGFRQISQKELIGLPHAAV